MSRWETPRKPWNKAPGWRGETPDEQKGSLLCNGPLVVYSSRLSALATAVIPIRSDGNASHIFSPHWSPHARFHGIVSMGMPVLLAPVSRLSPVAPLGLPGDRSHRGGSHPDCPTSDRFSWRSSFPVRVWWILASASLALLACPPHSSV